MSRRTVTRPEQLSQVPADAQELTLWLNELNEQQLAAVPWQQLTRLTSLSLWSSRCTALQRLLAEISSLTNLTSLTVSVCTALTELPAEISSLTNLASLSVRRCDALQELPAGISSLTNLTSLAVRECDVLQRLPAEISGLTNLQSLEFEWCALRQLPAEISGLANLQSLTIKECVVLQELPAEISCLTNLQSLDVSWCSALQELPAGICNLTMLEYLNVRKCQALTKLPEVFGNLTALTDLDLSFCGLQSLPDSCEQLKALRRLWYSECLVFKGIGAVACWGAVPCVRLRWDLQATHTDGYQVVCTALKPQPRRKAQQAAITKLATQQDTMLTTLEQMSWLVVLLATATFVAYLQPPGGLDDKQKQVLVSNVTYCGSDFMRCAMLLFFVFDELSFGLSVGCLVLIVMLSMPRIQWKEEQAEAGRFYVLLLFTWLLLYLAVSFGFAAFIASRLAMHAQRWMVLGPVFPGMVLLLAGALFFLHRFHTLNPGCAAVWAARPFRERELAPVESDVELGQARFWREWPQYMSRLAPGTATTAAAAQQATAHGPGGVDVGETTHLLGQQAGPSSSSRLQQPCDAAAATP